MCHSDSKNPIVLWIILAFLIWLIVFFPFLSSKLSIFEDAPSYYAHTKFFVENLAKGVYPLWDPFWYNGASNDFFLRRIGSFNPLYLLILLLESFKIPFTYAYLWSLAFYFWGGMIAFYLLAMRLYQNRLIAYGGYLFLLFSTLGTRLFDSYMMLITVPILWFFYCLVAFSQTPRKSLFLGICLSFMTLSTTYIPFYFYSFLAVFLIFFVLFYCRQIPEFMRQFWNFIEKNKLLTLLTLAIVFLSFLPPLMFFHNSSQGLVVMPARHGGLATGQTLIVPTRALDWGAIEDLLFSSYFSNFRVIRFAVVYIPFFAFIVFTLGLFCRMTRRAMFMFTCGFVFLCCIVPRGLPFYDFLYQHVFFLKYFRNLHFFLWFALIPLFVLLILEHWKMFLEAKLDRNTRLNYVWGIHVLVFLIIFLRADAIPTTYIMLILSAVFWSGLILNRGRIFWMMGLLSLAVIIQPLEVYHYLKQRASPFIGNVYGYDFPYNKLVLKGEDLPSLEWFSPNTKGAELYYAAGPFNSVYQNMPYYPLLKYTQYKFILVDNLEVLNRQQVDFSTLEKYFWKNDNKAFIFKDSGVKKLNSNDPHPLAQANVVTQENADFKILSFNANRVKILIQVPYEKFLIYNDSFDPNWGVKVNGQSVPLYQTNVAFKGLWIPAGKSIIEFRYGHLWQYGLNALLLISSLGLLMAALWLARQEKLKESI
jgi:hypothetical protein